MGANPPRGALSEQGLKLWLAPVTASIFNQLGQYAKSPVSSLVAATTIASTHYA